MASGRAGIGGRRDSFVRWRLHHYRGFSTPPGRLGAEVIGHPAQGHVDQPSARVVRHALSRPLRRRGEQGLLHRVLGGREVAEPANDRAEHLRRELAQQMLPGEPGRGSCHMSTGGALITWRTSIAMLSGTPPLPGADDALAAISYARSVRSTSTIQ